MTFSLNDYFFRCCVKGPQALEAYFGQSLSPLEIYEILRRLEDIDTTDDEWVRDSLALEINMAAACADHSGGGVPSLEEVRASLEGAIAWARKRLSPEDQRLLEAKE